MIVVRNVVERRSESLERRARAEVHSGRERRRFGATYEARTADGDALTVRGYASTTDEPYLVRDWLGEYTEEIVAGAFAKTLSERSDVRFLVNHDGIPLARTKSGTLVLTEDGRGLDSQATFDERSTYARDVWFAIDRGDMDEMSFMFRVHRQDWNEDYTHRWIREVELFDVSAVTFPANPATSIGTRNSEALAVASRRGLRLRAAAAAL
jgi:HK97 family phage prohead protease